MVKRSLLFCAVCLMVFGCVGNEGDSGDEVPYQKDTDSSYVPDVTERPIEYDTSIDPNASFDFDLDGLPYVGVNMSGAEWGGLPTWPTRQITRGYASFPLYFKDWGMTTVRLPFSWSKLQKELGGELDETYFMHLKVTAFTLRKDGANVILDMHDYARYPTDGDPWAGDLIGSAEVSFEDYADVWRRLAEAFKAYPEFIFAIMNEPHDMDTQQWVDAANAAIKAIRDTGAKNLIFVNGNGWSGAHSWEKSWTDESGMMANGEAMLKIEDPLNKIVFDVHQYLNEDSSDWGECVSSKIGSQRMQGFTNWLRANNKKGFLGEFGSFDDETCLAALDDQLNHIEEYDDVWVGWTWWSAGPGCTEWQRPIDPYCWKDSENGSSKQADLLKEHLK